MIKEDYLLLFILYIIFFQNIYHETINKFDRNKTYNKLKDIK